MGIPQTRQRKDTKSYVLIGATGEGKNTLADYLVNGQPCLYYDVQNNYINLPLDPTAVRGRFFGDYRKFIAHALVRRDSFIIFDEATATLQGKMDEPLRMALSSKQWHGNNWIFLFHTVRSVPPYLMDTADYIVLFKTGDDEKEVARRRSKLVPYFRHLQQAPKYSKHIIKNI